MLTSSGQAANFYAVFNICEAGDHIIISSALYGGTFNLLTTTVAKMGIETTVVDPEISEEELQAAIKPNTKCILAESVSNPSLVEACHIVDWANDIHNRTNPHNGLCRNPFLHKAYDEHLIAITPDFEVVVSDQLLDSVKSTHYINYLQLIQHSKIKLPNRFLPHKDFLAIHYENYLSFVY